MSYRFLKVATLYPGFLDLCYAASPESGRLPYEEQLAWLMAGGFGWADYLARGFRALGVDAREIVANAEPLQQAWAREHGSAASGPELVAEQVREFRPQVLFIQDPYRFTPDWLAEIRRAVPELRLLVGWCCAPYTRREAEFLRALDLVLTCTPGFVDSLRGEGIETHLSPHAFEPGLLDHLNADNPYPASELLFVGSVMAGEGFHNERRLILERLLRDNLGLDIYGTLSGDGPGRALAKRILWAGARCLSAAGLPDGVLGRMPLVGRAARWERPPRAARYSRRLRGAMRSPLFGVEMLKALSRAQVGLNMHIDAAGRYAGNVRLFETTGVGTCLLTDWKDNLPDLFDPDREVVAYRGADDCAEKARWLVDHPRERAEIARAGQARTLRDYTFAERARRLHALIEPRL